MWGGGGGGGGCVGVCGCLCLYLSLSVCLSVCLYLCLYASVCLSFSLFFYLSTNEKERERNLVLEKHPNELSYTDRITAHAEVLTSIRDAHA